MAKVILSTVGTSLLTNTVQADLRGEIIRKSNLSIEEGQKDEKLQGIIEYVIKPKIKENLEKNDLKVFKRMSAELNGIISIYDDELTGYNDDIHILIATDTYQGVETSNLIAEFLQQKNFVVIQYVPRKLSTLNKNLFLDGMKDLLNWFEDENGLDINKYKRSGYEIIFNLTGGFKSLQGYLNVIGMFYADKITYIFERSSDLIEIPKLPIIINDKLFKKYSSELALMAQDMLINRKDVAELPETLLDIFSDNEVTLSAWGLLSWNKVKDEILSEKLIPFSLISYDETFKRDFERTARKNDKVKLQETIAKISSILQQSNGNITKLKGGQAGGILYDNYSGKNSHLGHFRITQGVRVSCLYENNILKLRHYGEHDYVNDNP